MKRITFLVGATASGKDYVKRNLQMFINIPSVTTRKQRRGEIPNEDYYFISNEEFEELIKNGELCEHIKVGEANYGIKKQVLIDHIKEFSNVTIIVEPNGLLQILKYLNHTNDFDKYNLNIDIVYFSFNRVTRFLNLVFEEFKNELDPNLNIENITFLYLKTLDDKKQIPNSLIEDEIALEKMERVLNRLVRNGDNIGDLWKQNINTIMDLILSLNETHRVFLKILETKTEVSEYIEQVNDNIHTEEIFKLMTELKTDQLYKLRNEIKIELNKRSM
jgi:guanylate kinase